MKVQEQFKAARRVSTPLITILTQDPAGTISWIKESVNGETPCLSWDIISGLSPLNSQGKEAFDSLGVDSSSTINPSETLSIVQNLPPKSILFFKNAHRFLEPTRNGSESISQGIWNLRDEFKTNRRALVLLAPEINLPAELRQDILILEEELPNDQELEKIVLRQYKAVRAKYPDFSDPNEKILNSAVNALKSLSSFSAEQATAISLTKEGLNLDFLWQQKIRKIEQTKGLSVERGTETFSDIGGLEQIKKFSYGLFQGEFPPKLVVRIEEIEKVLGGIEGDSSGVAKDALQVILTEMEDQKYSGLIALGPPGSGKSLYSKALGNSFEILSLVLDMGAARGSLVGQSESYIREAMKVIYSIAGKGGAFFVATCNKLGATVPPELRRRFRFGVWYWDLPSEEEKLAIWNICERQYNLSFSPETRPNDLNFTGSDIRNVCEIAKRLNCDYQEAIQYIVPVAKSDPEGIRNLRELANNRFLSASSPGLYQMEKKQDKRAIDLE